MYFVEVTDYNGEAGEFSMFVNHRGSRLERTDATDNVMRMWTDRDSLC
jgi:hypothetical protein